MNEPIKIDLHMHTTVSDGTDTPEIITQKVREAGIKVFAVTDHDAIKSSGIIPGLIEDDDITFITGVEFSCKDEKGKYHILGYGYDNTSEGINSVVDFGHECRMKKMRARIGFVKDEFGFSFPDEETEALLAMDNPGKPHLGNLMVKYGYAKTKDEAISQYINKIRFSGEYVRPEMAIKGILASNGIPVLAHPSYGDGDQLILGEDMDERLRYLMDFGLQGVEAFYSGFTRKIRDEILSFAKKYDLYVTAGSDYHGKNKMIELGDTGLDEVSEYPEGFIRFLRSSNHTGRNIPDFGPAH